MHTPDNTPTRYADGWALGDVLWYNVGEQGRPVASAPRAFVSTLPLVAIGWECSSVDARQRPWLLMTRGCPSDRRPLRLRSCVRFVRDRKHVLRSVIEGILVFGCSTILRPLYDIALSRHFVSAKAPLPPSPPEGVVHPGGAFPKS
jgi:hypothetical protein